MDERHEKQNDIFYEVFKLRTKMVGEKAKISADLLDISRAFLNEALVVMITTYGHEHATEMLARVVDEMRAGGNTMTVIHKPTPSTPTID